MTQQQKWPWDDRNRPFDAYHYGFEPTGDEAIDLVLKAVAWAGKEYHNTSEWSDDDYEENPDTGEWGTIPNSSVAELIQRAAEKAAEMRRAAAQPRAEVGRLVEIGVERDSRRRSYQYIKLRVAQGSRFAAGLWALHHIMPAAEESGDE